MANAVNQDVPTEFQRLFATMTDLDKRVVIARETTQEKVNECLELPALHSRGLSKENERKIERLRKEIEESHEHEEMLAKEKTRLARLALEVLEKNVLMQTDEDLRKFQEELKQTAQELDMEMQTNVQRDHTANQDRRVLGGLETPQRGPSRQGERFATLDQIHCMSPSLDDDTTIDAR